MQSRTPQFDSALDKILEDLVPHTRTCKWKGEHPHCEGEFEILDEDIKFLKMLRVPAPNYCPTCRRMRRLSNMNMSRLFKRPCNAPNHGESMISILPEECPFPVYDYKYYISDEFDAFSFGRKFNEEQSPMEQLLSLRKVFPMPSFLNRDPSSVNSDYSNGGRNSKNAYYTMACFNSEDVWYSNLVRQSRDIMDSRMIQFSEHIYSSLASENIYKSSFMYFSKDCTDSMFLYDCKNCDSCFGSVNLRNAKYCVWNQQLSKEEYKSFMDSIYPLTRENLEIYKQKFWELVKTLPLNASRNISSENVVGVILSDTRNVYDVNDCEGSEHIRHADGGYGHKDSMDFLFSGGNCSSLYGCTNVGSKCSNIRFSISSKSSTNSEFIFNCNNIHNCFMCFGLRDKSYCILNVQYSPEEYFLLVDQIKSKMLENGEYVDGPGLEFSAQSYNFSMGQISFPLNNEEILKFGGYVAQEPESNAGDIEILSEESIPRTIDETSDEIVNYAIECRVIGKPFRILSSELQFYRKMKLPIPNVHPMMRIYERLAFLQIVKNYEANCMKCHKEIRSVFDPKDKFILYCESCYQQEVY